jgi:hypothetical protein
MRSLLLLTLTLCSLQTAFAQDADMSVFDTYNRERNAITRTNMLVLGGWGLGNMAGGLAGVLTTPKGTEANYFHQMNIYWNVVNVGIAVPGFLSARKRMGRSYDIPTTFKEQRKMETSYLINIALDGLYIGTGLWMQEFGNGRPANQRALLKGMGNSIMMQGGFLLLFDAVSFAIHRTHWNRNMKGIFGQMQFNGTSIVLPIK